MSYFECSGESELNEKGLFLFNERRGWDSNPRCCLTRTRHFQCRTFGLSVTSRHLPMRRHRGQDDGGGTAGGLRPGHRSRKDRPGPAGPRRIERAGPSATSAGRRPSRPDPGRHTQRPARLFRYDRPANRRHSQVSRRRRTHAGQSRGGRSRSGRPPPRDFEGEVVPAELPGLAHMIRVRSAPAIRC